jgi:hypothetical protein
MQRAPFIDIKPAFDWVVANRPQPAPTAPSNRRAFSVPTTPYRCGGTCNYVHAFKGPGDSLTCPGCGTTYVYDPLKGHGPGSPTCTDRNCPCQVRAVHVPAPQVRPRRGHVAPAAQEKLEGEFFYGRVDTPGPRCECGSESVGLGGHSTWCPRFS